MINRKKLPKGWRNFNEEIRHRYPNQRAVNPYFQSVLCVNPDNNLAYFHIIGYTTEPICTSASKKQIAYALKQLLHIKKYICVLDSHKQTRHPFDYMNELQFHTILNDLPTPEEIDKIEQICTTYQVAEEEED